MPAFDPMGRGWDKKSKARSRHRRRCTALQSTVYSWLEKMVDDELNGKAIDSTSVVGPAQKLIPESMMT